MGKYPQRLIEQVYYWNESWKDYDENPKSVSKPKSIYELIKDLETIFGLKLTEEDILEIVVGITGQ